MDTCQSEGKECGTVCGVDCGLCETGETCSAGTCIEVTSDVSCLDCSLRLSVLNKESTNDTLTALTLVVDYFPTNLEPRPRIADVRLNVPAGLVLDSLTLGIAGSSASKELYVDPESGSPWKIRSDGSIQALVVALDNSNNLESGRLLTYTFSIPAPQAGPVSVNLVKRDQTFAPPDSDSAIDATAYDNVLEVSP
jgi:hypothetical protein